MADARIFGFFSILLGSTMVVLSSFLEAMPVFLVVGVITGTGIVFSGAIIVATFLSARFCPECGETLREGSYQCPICGHQVSNKITPSLIRRLLH